MLCFSTNLSSSDLAAWVQAIGSILAIIFSVGIAIWQSSKQHKSALEVQSAERQQEKIEVAKTLSELAACCLKAMEFLGAKVKSREAIYNIVEGQVRFDMGELQRVDAAIAAIPLHDLPHTLVRLTLILGATVRQFKEKIEQVFRVHRTMNAHEFEDFFQSIDGLNDSLRATCKDIASEVKRLESKNGG